MLQEPHRKPIDLHLLQPNLFLYCKCTVTIWHTYTVCSCPWVFFSFFSFFNFSRRLVQGCISMIRVHTLPLSNVISDHSFRLFCVCTIFFYFKIYLFSLYFFFLTFPALFGSTEMLTFFGLKWFSLVPQKRKKKHYYPLTASHSL